MFCSKKDWSNIINILYKSKKELIMSYLWCIILIN
jgi:hypothetical protein